MRKCIHYIILLVLVFSVVIVLYSCGDMVPVKPVTEYKMLSEFDFEIPHYDPGVATNEDPSTGGGSTGGGSTGGGSTGGGSTGGGSTGGGSTGGGSTGGGSTGGGSTGAGNPEIEQIFLSSEFGFFGSEKVDHYLYNIYTTPEEFKFFDPSHFRFITGIYTKRVVGKVFEHSDGNKKRIQVQALGMNYEISNYTVHLIIDKIGYNSSDYMSFTTSLALASTSNPKIRNNGIVNGQFEEKGKVLKLSRSGNGRSINDGYYTYDFIKVYDVSKALYKNRLTGNYILMCLQGNSSGNHVYFYEIDGGTTYAAKDTTQALASAVVQGALLTFSAIISGNFFAILGVSLAQIGNMIYVGGYVNNNDLTLNKVTSSGYMLYNFNTYKKTWWGTF